MFRAERELKEAVRQGDTEWEASLREELNELYNKESKRWQTPDRP